MDAPFFVVGCPRSGTTLLRDLLRSHPEISIPPESHFVPVFYRAWGEPRDPEEVERLARRILALHWVRRFEVELVPHDFRRCRSYAEMIERLYGEVARRDDARLWGDKTPAYALHMPTLAELFPPARFVHIVRDGRDVACSLIRTQIGPRHRLTAGRLWSHYLTRARRDAARLAAGRYLEIRYESLLGDPETVLRSVCSHLGVTFDPRVLAPTPIDQSRFPDVFGPRRVQHASATRIVPENTGKWRREMTASEIGQLEAVVGSLLSALGYALDGPRHSRAPGRATWIALRCLDRLLWAGYQFRRPNKRRWLPSELAFNWARLRGLRATRSAAPSR